MGDVIDFPDNLSSGPFERYINRCGKPSPISGEPCQEQRGHTCAHTTAPDDLGMSTGWWDNPPSVNNDGSHD